MAPKANAFMAPADDDQLETQEWLDALAAVLDREGPERAHYILERLTVWHAGQGLTSRSRPTRRTSTRFPLHLSPPIRATWSSRSASAVSSAGMRWRWWYAPIGITRPMAVTSAGTLPRLPPRR